MKKPPPSITLSSAEVEAIIARVHRSNLAPADAGVVAQVFRLYVWVAFAIQKGIFNMKQLRRLLFGPGREGKATPECEASSSSSDELGQAEGAEPPWPVDEVVLDAEVVQNADGPSASEVEASSKVKGGHRKGTGRLGAAAYMGAEHTECRHEELEVGQRCPVCGQGTLYELPPGSEIRIDGHALLSAMHYELQKLRCSACGEIFTASLPPEAGAAKYSARARAVLVVSRYYLGLPLGVTGRPQQPQAAISISLFSGMSIGSTSARCGYKRWVSFSMR